MLVVGVAVFIVRPCAWQDVEHSLKTAGVFSTCLKLREYYRARVSAVKGKNDKKCTTSKCLFVL